jgi:hypothetical protein
MKGWMWQVYVNVPTVSKVRVTDVLALTPVISAGAPVALSKKMLCPTDPNANVTVCPTLVVSVDGSNARDAVALT